MVTLKGIIEGHKPLNGNQICSYCRQFLAHKLWFFKKTFPLTSALLSRRSAVGCYFTLLPSLITVVNSDEGTTSSTVHVVSRLKVPLFARCKADLVAKYHGENLFKKKKPLFIFHQKVLHVVSDIYA